MPNAIKAGVAANLLYGYRPVWDPTGDDALPFFTPPQQPVVNPTQVDTPTDFPYWVGTPVITLHHTPQSLVSAIYRYDVLPVANDPQTIDIPSGPLALDDADSADALAAAAAFLGLDFSKSGNFMLVTYERWTSSTTASWSGGRAGTLTPAALGAFDALPPASPPQAGSPLYDSKLTIADAQAYLTTIGQFGTHYVREVRNGDLLLQVFAFDDSRFKYIATQFASAATMQPGGYMAVSGMLANSWIIYTAPASTGGYVSSYGALTTIGRDPALGAAIAAGLWANGYVPDGTASIFAASTDYILLEALTENVPYACSLSPLADLMPSALVQGPWDRLVAGGLLQKYGDAVVIPLRRPLAYDWASIFPQSTDSWASGIVTPTIDIYQERVDLAAVNLMGSDIIGESYPMQSFSCFTQVLQATATAGAPPIFLPSDSVTLVAQIIDTTQAAQTPVLTMSATALQQLTVACEEMYGTLIFQVAGEGGGPTRRRTALDGFLLETGATPDPASGRYTVGLAGVLTDAPAPAVLEAHGQSVEFSVMAGEALIQASGPDADTVRGLEISYLDWLARIIPADTQDDVLAHARVRALYLANSVADFGSGTVFVPYVTYDTYANYVGALVTQATTLATQIAQYQNQLVTVTSKFQVMTSIDAVNANVRAIGGVLVQYFQALADNREQMNGYYQNIIAQLDTQLQATLANITDLQKQLAAQQTRISSIATPIGIVQQFEQDYADYEKDEVFKAAMEITTGIFSLGVAFAGIPGAAEKGVLEAFEALEKVYDKLQSVMQVLSQLRAIESATGDLSKINALAGSIQVAADGGTLEMPSPVDIQMIPNNITAALANVPTSGKLQQDKANLIAAVTNLSLIGGALLNAQAQASSLLVEIANNQRLIQINGQQQADMSALTHALNLSNPGVPPDLAKIDLIGMTGQLQFQLKQVLSTLAKVLSNQNGAIQFTYFGQPAAISSFSLNALLSVISTQNGNIINAIEALNPPPQKVDAPVTVSVKSIPWKELVDGRFKRLSIHLSEPGFNNYVMVRIDRVVPRVLGVQSTTSGDYELALSTNAQPFLDRGPDRDTRIFASSRRAFGPYVYDVATGKPKFGDHTGTFDANVTHLTPFGDWNLSFPAKSTNAGIAFDELLVDIEIDFYITAIYNDPVESVRRALLRGSAPSRHTPALLAASDHRREAVIRAAVTSDAPTLAYLEGQMYQNQAVLNGWDAAFSMLSGPVNAFLNQQFQAYLKTLHPGSDTGLMPIDATYFGPPVKTSFKGQVFWQSQVTSIRIDLTNPLLQFVASSDQATIQQYIKDGSVTVGTVDVNGSATFDSTFNPNDAYLPAGPLPFTVDTATSELVIASPNVLGSGLGSIYLSTSGTLPAPLVAGDPTTGANEYFITGWTSSGGQTRIQLSADPAGTTPIALTSAGTGTQTLTLGVSWSPPVVVDVGKAPYVYANVQLSTIRGVVEPPAGQGDASKTLTVMLDFPSGSFVLRNIHVEPPNWDPAPNATQISAAIANYYAQNEIDFQVQTINTTNLASDVDLTPSKFVLHAMNTNADNNILQLLMVTTGTPPTSSALALTEPVAYDPKAPVAGSSDFMISLMISSKLTFKHVFVDSFNRNSTNFEVQAVPPKVDYEAWSAIMSKGSITAAVPFADTYDVNGTTTKFRISQSSNDLTWDLTGLTFTRTPTTGIQLNYTNGTASPPSGGKTVDFQYQQYLYAPGGRGYPGHWYWSQWSDASAVAYVSITGNYPLNVTESGTNQQIGFKSTAPKIDVDQSSDLKPTGACECNNNDLQIALLASLADNVPGALQTNMEQISFQPLSIMALESLLFPADQLIAMSQATVPADTLVVGRFLAQVRKTASSYTVTIPASSGAKGSFGGVSFESGTTVNSVTRSGEPHQFQFTYGPIDPSLGGQVTYTIDIEAGTVSPPLIAVVYQPDATGNPQNVTLLLPGYGVNS